MQKYFILSAIVDHTQSPLMLALDKRRERFNGKMLCVDAIQPRAWRLHLPRLICISTRRRDDDTGSLVGRAHTSHHHNKKHHLISSEHRRLKNWRKKSDAARRLSDKERIKAGRWRRWDVNNFYGKIMKIKLVSVTPIESRRWCGDSTCRLFPRKHLYLDIASWIRRRLAEWFRWHRRGPAVVTSKLRMNLYHDQRNDRWRCRVKSNATPDEIHHRARARESVSISYSRILHSFVILNHK